MWKDYIIGLEQRLKLIFYYGSKASTMVASQSILWLKVGVTHENRLLKMYKGSMGCIMKENFYS